jgi:G3E family GTPase
MLGQQNGPEILDVAIHWWQIQQVIQEFEPLSNFYVTHAEYPAKVIHSTFHCEFTNQSHILRQKSTTYSDHHHHHHHHHHHEP